MNVVSFKIVSHQEMREHRARMDKPSTPEDERPKSAEATIKLQISENESIDTVLIGVLLPSGTYCLTQDQLESFSDQSILNVLCLGNPKLADFIKENRSAGRPLSFIEDQKEPIWIPFNRSATAGVIMAFYNGRGDPLERVSSLFQSVDYNPRDVGRILITYYLCCLKYMTDLDFRVYNGQIENIRFLTDDTALIPRHYRNAYLDLKTERRNIPPGLLGFHAVYGAYALCRPVANKREFKTWVTKRYSAFMASIQQTAEVNVNLDLQKGGNFVNETAVERSQIRRLIYGTISATFEDVRAAAVKTHIKMLTALSEMTTYSLIQKVITQGGAVMTLSPIPTQLQKYVQERNDVINDLERAHIPQTDIVYLHLVMPQRQCFTASEYADLVVTAQVIDEINDSDHRTLDQYKAKTQNATISRKKLKQFLLAQSGSSSLKIDRAGESSLSALIGDNAKDLYAEAEKILKMISQQRNMLMED